VEVSQEQNIARRDKILAAFQSRMRGATTLEEKLEAGFQLELECALWTVETLDAYKFLPIPVKPPQVKRWEDMDSHTKATIDTRFYFKDHPEIATYYDTCQKARVMNRSHYEWLEKSRAVLAKAGKMYEAALVGKRLQGITVEQLMDVNRKELESENAELDGKFGGFELPRK
jgi:hypothetical protein